MCSMIDAKSDSLPTQAPATSQHLSLVFWTTTAMILGFMVLIHLGVLLCFLTTHAALPWVIPTALITALWLGDFLGRREGLSKKSHLWPLGLMFGITLLAVGISAVSYDLSWDGQWYHQTGIYSMAQGWNPLSEPLQTFAPHNELWVRHYAKGPWYIATAMMALTGQIETGKFATWMMMAAAFMAVAAACLDAGIRPGRALALGAVLALNPVVTSEIVSFLVDGLMVCYLVCYVAALISALHRANLLVVFVGMATVICSINSKFTGLIFLCFICTAAGLYCLTKRRDRLWSFVGLNLLAIILGVGVFGYNPYATNTIHRSQPFYPLLGSKAFPSMAEQGNDVIELYETPPNMMGRNRLIRFGYAVFGRPSFSPYNNQPTARLMWPFATHLRDLDVYRFHDTRIAGFGPFFSGALILSLFLAGWILFTPPMPRYLLLLSYGILAASLLISIHLWWARYGPQMWWFPILPVAAVFWGSRSRLQLNLAWALVGILLVNAFLVAAVRLHWEFKSTQTLRRQLVALRNTGREIEIDMGRFGTSVGERLQTWDIPFQPTRLGRARDCQELMSVARGNPGAVRYRFKQPP
jgi:hypothetical protein